MAAAEPKDKTKAKKRYLKAKKERRKQRKVAPNPSVRKTNADVEEGSAVGSDDEMEVVRALAGDEVDVEPVSASARDEAGEGRKDKKGRKKKYKPDGQDREETGVPRPRKRRKVEHNEESEGEEDVLKLTATSAKLASPDLSQSPPATTRGTPTPPLPSTLPSFPLPSRPNAPARSELVSQGLDRALAHAQIVDPGLSVPLSLNDDEMSAVGLGSKMRSRLTELGISELFAVQTTLLPLLLPSERLKRALYLPYDPPRDICVSAPTGSGKTLAYVLPIVETLSFRIVTRLRALVVLPTRDLVTQVQETFETIGKGRGLKIGTVTGQHSFAHEQAQLIADKSTRLQGGSSKVDILICTPGRLMDHLTGTPGFSLQHLRFLVIDEADRLLAQSFQDWLAQVLAATRPPSTLDVIGEPEAEVTDADVPYPDALAPAFIHLLRSVPTIRTDLDEKRETSCQKLLFSATLMSDPGKIAALELRDPQYIVVQAPNRNTEEGMLGVAMEKFSMPATLKEHMVVCDASQKPLILFHLVLMHGVRNALVFTKSTESTQRLVRLFDFFEKARMAGTGAADTTPVVVRAYSSDLSPSERKSILEKFKTQKVDILICSDLISRGIDISHVAHVVSYDAPVDMRKYVHRVGRTARAGRTGDAWTLVEEQEARYFKNMLRTADHADVVSRVRISGKQLASLTAFYEAALRELKDVYTHDKNVGE